MKMSYYKDTDSLYIDLSEKTSVQSLEIAPGVVVDFDENNHVVGIDIDHASRNLTLSELEISSTLIKRLVLSTSAQQ
ncbi:hypothetical protein MBAV_004539 [Candidatus Magnetobacterium bavaricum]|uniref:DUF2283 domain-containing protein n=1 Tax=Candidatus Magnetobacterium bavaricum TaxID=29290 RepID=A0A0F3GRE2_9BACT|nr:hypothetical protein MBAV_004539 [Candidatus Magnetobacterium bavaricum]